MKNKLLQIMAEEKPSNALQQLVYEGELFSAIPLFAPSVGCTQNKWHEFDVWQHTLVCVDNCPASDPILRIAALFHDIGKPYTKAIQNGDATFYDHEIKGAELTKSSLEKLSFSTIEIVRIVHLVRHHYVRYDRDWTVKAVRRWKNTVGEEHVQSLLLLSKADIIAKGCKADQLSFDLLEELKEKLIDLDKPEPKQPSSNPLAINGKTIMDEFGLQPGILVGDIMRHLVKTVEENPTINERQELLKLATQFLRKKFNT